MSTTRGFDMAAEAINGKFPLNLNPHYDFQDPQNQAVIEAVEAYDRAFTHGDEAFLRAAERAALKGKDGYEIGVLVESPWGDNQVVSFYPGADGAPDTCIKEITVKPGFMLSLQRHRGRSELWEVLEGTLTVIKNGEMIEVPAGESVTLEAGDIHCMNNAHDAPVKVRETQTGICREADNVRLVDANNRPTYPLTTPDELAAGKLYAQLQQKIALQFYHMTQPSQALLDAA